MNPFIAGSQIPNPAFQPKSSAFFVPEADGRYPYAPMPVIAYSRLSTPIRLKTRFPVNDRILTSPVAATVGESTLGSQLYAASKRNPNADPVFPIPTISEPLAPVFTASLS